MRPLTPTYICQRQAYLNIKYLFGEKKLDIKYHEVAHEHF